MATADAIGLDRFHYLGYSLGGFVGCALARLAGGRLLSVSIGGWDLDEGMATAARWVRETFKVELSFGLMYSLASGSLPGVADASDDRRAGWARICSMLLEAGSDASALERVGVPLHLWAGRADAYAEPMAAQAARLGARFDLVDGDHFGAFQSGAGAPVLERFHSA